MGQKLYSDRIGQISFSTPNVLLAASILTIGGQQYVTGGLSVALPALTSAQLYMVYAVQTAGVVSLTISQNVNSVGPTGFLSWKLVGAFYADGTVSPTLGAFVSIEGTPASGPINYTPTLLGYNTNTISSVTFARRGDRMVGNARVTGGTSTPAEWRFGFPGTYTPSALAFSAGLNHNVGKLNYSAVNSANHEFVLITQPGQAYMNAGEMATNNGLSARDTSVLPGGITYSLFFEIPVTGWSVTPLRDL